ncbi:MAG: ATP-binding cassette domain-containing protein [Alphaproteobacteria bacterium]|nr:ATP-binding cassette domain-containing protein [Alphaproteobacteria bacterium]
MLDRPTPGSLGAELLRLEAATVRIGEATLIDRVDLAVHRREIVTVVGPNGGGKTTLIKAALGLTPLAAGRVAARSGLRIGYVPQRFAPDPVLPLTVDRFLTLSAPAAAAARREALVRVGAAGLASAQLATLSGGELRRVLLARALLREPELLVLDEPVAGVDVAGQPELYDVIAALARERDLGVLMASHDMHLVMAASTRVLCLNRHVCCAGQPDAVTRHPEYIALFGSAWVEGLAVYSHHHDHRHDAHGNVVHGHNHDHSHSHDDDHTHGADGERPRHG